MILFFLNKTKIILIEDIFTQLFVTFFVISEVQTLNLTYIVLSVTTELNLRKRRD